MPPDPARPASSRFRLSFDIGGTFTDFVLVDQTSGQTWRHKALTTPTDPALGALAGLDELLGERGVSAADIAMAIHGTTLAANALIERRGARTALLVTRGFRDVLEMGRENRYDIYDLALEKPRPLVPRRLRLELDERLDKDGEVLRPLDRAEARALAGRLAAEDIEAVAICLLHAFRNPAHERMARDELAAEAPGLAVSISSEVAPEIGEFERMATTAANAYVQPLVARYLATVEAGLRERGYARPLYLMLSSGGTTTAKVARRFPVRLIESGPAAGVLASQLFGRLAGEESLVAFDMGGTTAKCSAIRRGAPRRSSTLEVARVRRFKKGSGITLRIPAIDMIEIGAGGGSIACVDSLGLLKVGPESAGADPGSACYGRGGREPTVTDADLLLGYLDPDYFLGGRMRLDRAAAERAVERAVAGPLGVSVSAAAYGIFQVVNENMASATRIHIAESGADPRDFWLVATGGAGPVHAHQIARPLRMRGFICPPSAGVASAFGLLAAPISFDLARSLVARIDQLDPDQIVSLYRELEAEARQLLRAAGVAEAAIRFSASADMRHAGQGHQITIPLGNDATRSLDVQDLAERFYRAYEAVYRHAHRDIEPELLTCRLEARGGEHPLELAAAAHDPASAERALKGRRPAFFQDAGGFAECPVYDRYGLTTGACLVGPAIIEERESTTVLGPNMRGTIDAHQNLKVELI